MFKPKAQPLRGVKSAFTLIELLVVIAIIAILASILFPVFARARENARASSCLSNLKQFGLAIEQYKQDYDGMYPFARYQLYGRNWFNWFLDPYVKSDQLHYCPSRSDWKMGYGYNIAFGYFPGNNITPSRSGLFGGYCGTNIPMYDGVNEAIVTNPSESVVMIDSTLSYYYLTSPPVSYSDATAKGAIEAFFPQTSDTTMKSYYNHPEAGIHNSGLNGLYADGHAKWRKVDFYLDNTVWCPVK